MTSPMLQYNISVLHWSDRAENAGKETHHVIETVRPERLARKHVQLQAGRALGEDRAVDGDLR